ncbi:hypothetical protein GPECTOR_3g18 [Gonium pectorale]|uniref:Uncharacterized protein n=1 Tax=Gonium pectorale TaxID=33097 RepID=A0A150GYN6_GONPE|nr:hypothetical protein GPECTOR_3g18 [Gonium pectorale]|eukprot:KXZ55017.1 hypothetical protein GPECTOR_3g18 [Gonium pectorale]
MIGFHEGTRRAVECKGGFLSGVQVGYIEDSWSFAEPFIGSVRLMCSNHTLNIQHFGDVADTYVFGRLDLKSIRKAECPEGVTGFRWRAAKIKNPDGAEMRQSGLVVMCNRANNSPSEVILEHGAVGSHQYDKTFSCRQVAQYGGLPAPKLSKAYIWFNRKSFAGLEPTECA